MALPEEARSGLVICHPHPLYGGDMDNPTHLVIDPSNGNIYVSDGYGNSRVTSSTT